MISSLPLSRENFNKYSFPIFEFHIAKEVRKKYGLDNSLFSINGNVVLADFRTVRLFTQKINANREVKDHVVPGQINAAGLLDEIYHFLFRLYEMQINPGVFKKALVNLNSTLGEEETQKLLIEFVTLFPPTDVYTGTISPYNYINSFTADRSNTEITLEEMILLHIANFNPANQKIIELFDENYFIDQDLYKKAIINLDLFFQNEKKFGPDEEDIFTVFKNPIIKNPNNLEAQLEYLVDKWGIIIEKEFLKRILSSKDLIKEDFQLYGFGSGGAPTAAPVYKEGIDAEYLTLGKSGYKYAADSWKDFIEPENFTKDIDWMPNVVLLAKNAYVWLDQLSKKYQRHIKTLDQVPDEELDQIARWGFNGLWLIGVWERSSASKKIKHILGNIDAVASAYSLYDYQIAWDLGGEDAYHALNHRAKMRGIRLASDMVPNHTGIFSKWIQENAHFFIQSDFPPFPNYSFTGPDLSDDQSFQIRIEDGYWSKSDAAVVFQRINNHNGQVQYIYHGNDGTNMPWNDTAQLNMLRGDVREAVIQKIFDVARKFSIIRFDAAMTLTKRHFSRLWYPEPGKGGDIPSRADYALTKDEFDKQFPEEFWREVVDRINAEMPETLLLAEAFWLLEGYFVRSLGMHRVYNSAFMHMMMKEENEKYRDAISNTLEFEPEILKRYVNFMSNPDEETAIKQFGSDDKYFGVCTVLVTLPGLPMFGHGQVEGYTEKYGMEYQRAYYNEFPNKGLIERHEREIFPLMKKRYLFSHVSNFWLYDFINGYDQIDENVFAYTNMEWGERAIVFYNNKYQFTSGSILRSSLKLVSKEGETKKTDTRTISEALRLNNSENCYYIYREQISNLEFIRSGKDFEKYGFALELDAFSYKVFLDFREVVDIDGKYKTMAEKLNGQGTPNIEYAIKEMELEPIHNKFNLIFSEESIQSFIDAVLYIEDDEKEEEIIRFLDEEYRDFLNSIRNQFKLIPRSELAIEKFESEIRSMYKLNRMLKSDFATLENPKNLALQKRIVISSESNYRDNAILFMIWLTISNIKKIIAGSDKINTENYLEELLLTNSVKQTLKKLGRGESAIPKELALLNLLLESELPNAESKIEESDETSFCSKMLIKAFDNENAKKFINVNEYQGIVYYSKENFSELLDWYFTLLLLEIVKTNNSIKTLVEQIQKVHSTCQEIIAYSDKSGYKIDQLITMLDEINEIK